MFSILISILILKSAFIECQPSYCQNFTSKGSNIRLGIYRYYVNENSSLRLFSAVGSEWLVHISSESDGNMSLNLKGNPYYVNYTDVLYKFSFYVAESSNESHNCVVKTEVTFNLKSIEYQLTLNPISEGKG